LSPFTVVCAAAVTVFAVARLGRLIGFDTYPPVAWLRAKWDQHTEDSDWNKLVHCGYCSTPYLAAADLAWGYFTDWQTAWWWVNVWLAASYAAAYVIAYDGDDG
jgi:hypothetical protein